MGLSNKKEEELRKMPRVESRIIKSKDGKWIIQRTMISSIKPVQYYQKILESKEIQPSLEQFDDSDFFMQEGEELADG